MRKLGSDVFHLMREHQVLHETLRKAVTLSQGINDEHPMRAQVHRVEVEAMISNYLQYDVYQISLELLDLVKKLCPEDPESNPVSGD